MRILAACSLGGAGHFNPLMPFLRAARRRGDEVLTVGPPALREMVESAGFPVPLFADQFENARRLAKTRAGLVVETQITAHGARSINAAAAPRITSSIEDVLGDGTYRDRARAIATEMAATATVEEVLARLPSDQRPSSSPTGRLLRAPRVR